VKKILYTVIGAVALVLVVAMIVTACVYPMINEVETGATPEYPEIQPQYYTAEPDRILDEVEAVVEALDRWEVVEVDRARRQVEAERTTRTFRFVDDVTIRVEPVTEFVAQVHLRSASRVGKNDLGQNARNIEEFFGELDDRLGAVKFEPSRGEEDEEALEGDEEGDGDEEPEGDLE
jgi:uncharacterized protein (DUF1499 family)